jgi:hypothetical protein
MTCSQKKAKEAGSTKMSFANIHQVLRAGASCPIPAVFAGQDLQQVVWRALDASNKWHRRHCTLQAPLVVTSVIGMSLHRSQSIVEVFKNTLDVARGMAEVSLTGVTAEALYHARSRLGFEPLRLVATQLAAQGVPTPTFLGLIPYAIDGVKMNLPDTPQNEAEFGRPKASRGETAFPQMAGVALVQTDTHKIADCVWGPHNMSEFVGAEALLPHLGPNNVLFLDRRYTKVNLWFGLLHRQIHFVHRLSASYNVKRTDEHLGPGDWLADVGRWVVIPPDERVGRQKRRWETRKLRVIEYQVGDREKVQLLTDLLDPVEYTARDIALGYHLRWEIELTYDEVKTHLSTVQHGTLHTVFRSKTPNGVYQEAWAMIAAYNLIRGLMVEAGEKHQVPPLAISFVGALAVIRRSLPKLQERNAGKGSMLYRRLLRDIADCVIDRPRRKRSAPRAVKQKMSNFKLKRRSQRSVPYDFAAELKLVE